MSDTAITTRDLTPAAVEAGLLAFLAQWTKRTWEVDEDLFAGGGVSSLFALELVVHIEQAYGVAVTGDELSLVNFRTVRTMTSLVTRLAATGSGSGE
ncbi:phosphopantetheine-binding protein [Streptomyces sp. NPDC004549]|uniref:acyl carrier protein n=1 Tax=Streptomyces sp. NPDC004549 TaxID=3154283 RepID=UPI0033BD699B